MGFFPFFFSPPPPTLPHGAHSFNGWQFIGNSYIQRKHTSYVVSLTASREDISPAPGNHGQKSAVSGPLCVQIQQHGKDGALGEPGSLNALLYSPKNCEINHGFISLMHVHLVKAQENNYPSLLYTRRESLQRARLIQWRSVALPPRPAVSGDLPA